MEIKKIINLEEKKNYSKIAEEFGNIFNQFEWLKIFGNNLKLFGIYENNKIISGFYLYKEKKIGLNVYKNPPFTPYIGPFIQIPSNIKKQREIVSLLTNYTDNLPYAVISFSLNKNINDVIPFIWKKFKTTPHYTYVVNLNNDVEKIFELMSKDKKNDINKAVKDGLVVERINDLTIIKNLVVKTFSRQKKKINQLYLDKILFNFANDNNSFAFITIQNGEPIATSFCLYDKNSAYYLLGGYDEKNKHHGAGTLCLWESIKYAKKIGLKYFDFEGSIVPQIERYFRGFGGELVSYFRINKAKLPIEIILKFFKRELF